MSSTAEARAARGKRNREDAARLLSLYKTSQGCADCGYRDSPVALQFDHVDPRTKRRELGWHDDRSRLTTRAKVEAFYAHVQTYCEVRCANCHAVRTQREGHHLLERGGIKRDDVETLF